MTESFYDNAVTYLPESLDHMTLAEVFSVGAALTEFFALVRIHYAATDAYWCGLACEYGGEKQDDGHGLNENRAGRWWHPDRIAYPRCADLEMGPR